jgi:hypothetical protein
MEPISGPHGFKLAQAHQSRSGEELREKDLTSLRVPAYDARMRNGSDHARPPGTRLALLLARIPQGIQLALEAGNLLHVFLSLRPVVGNRTPREGRSIQ